MSEAQRTSSSDLQPQRPGLPDRQSMRNIPVLPVGYLTVIVYSATPYTMTIQARQEQETAQPLHHRTDCLAHGQLVLVWLCVVIVSNEGFNYMADWCQHCSSAALSSPRHWQALFLLCWAR